MNFMNINIFKAAINSILIVSISLLMCCREKEAVLTDEEKVRELLVSGVWVLQNVIVDGTNQTPLYSGLTLNFSANQITVQNANVVWNGIYIWSFTNSSAKSFLRDDGIIVSIKEISNSGLIIELNWTKTTFDRGKVDSVAGLHTFTFSK